jgi:hypothetical protein
MAAVEAFYRLRGRIFLAPLEELKTIITDNGIVVDKLQEIERGMAVKVVDSWLTEEVKGKDKGATALLSLKHYFNETPPVEKLSLKPGMEQVQGSESVRWRKELKISGQIGGDRKDGLGFLSLVRQMETASKRGYTETEVVEAVIKATQPGSGLRDYLEGRDNLTLPELRNVLRGHYKEKSATELYQELSNLAQSSKEEATDFLMRALGLRQRVLFANAAQISGQTYNKDLVQGMLIHALYTGFVSETVRHEMRPLLETGGVTDENLIEGLNTIELREAERKNKFGKGIDRTARTNSMEVNKDQNREPKLPKEGTFQTELNQLRAEVMQIKEILQQPTHPMQKETNSQADLGPKRFPRFQLGCEACQKSGTGTSCRHCWKCGSSEHYKSGCRAGRKMEGNDKGLHQEG